MMGANWAADLAFLSFDLGLSFCAQTVVRVECRCQVCLMLMQVEGAQRRKDMDAVRPRYRVGEMS